ncbi:hypothetical protein M9H77_23359 [Catharanthus roseus]|uniref:Uncharacterized protein n=1 Tax=Catharanthus roseus TaxID=4058 RepID=A0ACC0AX52_CATRO|nr:hypothetical protein M9H77_23359 [Catharanthus roseus]
MIVSIIARIAMVVKELPHAAIESKEVVETHVEKETFNEDSCDDVSETNIEIKEIERMEEKVRFVERFYIFDSNFIFSKDTEHLESSKEKESELVKIERVKGNECFIEKQEIEKKEEKREKEIVVLEKSEEVNFFANETNYFFASESLCVQNFEDSSKDEGRKLAYKSNNTINLFPSNSYLEKKQFIEFNSIFCAIHRVDEYHFNIVNYASCVLGVEDPMVSSGAKFDPSLYNIGVLDDTSLVDLSIVGFEPDCALLNIVHDECLGKFIEDIG